MTTSLTSGKVPLMTNADILNRIDDPTLCVEIMSQDRNGVIVFCEDEEYHPFTDRCATHV